MEIVKFNQFINESKGTKITKKTWDVDWSLDDSSDDNYQNRINALLSVVKDPNDTEKHVEKDYDELPPFIKGFMVMYESESVNEGEALIFNIVEPEFTDLKQKIESLNRNTVDPKWRKALDQIQREIEKLEFFISKYDTKLGAIETY